MSAEPKTLGEAVLRRFESYGFWVGAGLGLLVGVLMTGPYWREWPVSTSVWIGIGCVAVGAVIGFFSGPLATGAEARGPSISGAGVDVDLGAGADGGSSAGADGGGGGTD